MQGNLHFKIDWASLIVGSNLSFLLCFTLYLTAIFQVQAPGVPLEGRFSGGLFALLVWGAYIWRGLFSEFYSIFMFNIGSYCHNYVYLTIIPISSSYGCDLRHLTARVAHPSLCIRKQQEALHLSLLLPPSSLPLCKFISRLTQQFVIKGPFL